MMQTFDRYTLRARVFPLLVAAVPLFLAISAWIPFSQWPVKLAGGSIVLVIAAFAMAQLARDAGKRIEKPLWDSWGWPPTARMLQHRDRTFDEGSKDRMHRRLLEFGVVPRLPTRDEEAADPDAAHRAYITCSEWLRGKALELKGKAPFDVVHDENISYGYRRNLLGIRPAALAISALALLGIAAAFFFGRSPFIEWGAALAVAAYLAFGVNEAAFRRAADNYSERLLRAVEAIPSKPAKPSTAKSRALPK